jgi:hypothetical protein
MDAGDTLCTAVRVGDDVYLPASSGRPGVPNPREDQLHYIRTPEYFLEF